MAIFTVTTNADTVDAGDGKLSLREAVAQANATAAADTIRFAGALEGTSVVLTGGELHVTRDLTIDGDPDGDGLGVTIDGNESGRILNISGAGTDVGLHGLDLTDGFVASGDGAAIRVGADCGLTLTSCTVRDSYAAGASAGGIHAEQARVTILDSSIVGNTDSYGAGGIQAENSTLVIRRSLVSGNDSYSGAGGIGASGSLVIEDSIISNNANFESQGGGLRFYNGEATVARSTFSGNSSSLGGAISFSGRLTLTDSTIAANEATGDYGSFGAGIGGSGELIVRNSTITGNVVDNDSEYGANGGGIWLQPGFGTLDIANSIVAGNAARGTFSSDPDISGTISFSNGHNIFGGDVLGNVSGDRESIAASAIFASIDPATGGGQLNAAGIVPLKNAITNPALSGADPLAASDFGQLGTTGRPLPAGSLPDIGAIEINQQLSTTASANNDVLTGTGGKNSIDGQAGADLIKGLAGNDTLRGGDGGDVLDGGAGNDKLYGDAGIDLVFYGGSTKVTVDLSLATDKATRGSEVDTLYNVEGAIGSSKNDTFKGNEHNNLFQGGLGKDTATGGLGRDLYDFNAVAESKAGASTRDVITDFAHLTDKIDLAGIDADTTLAGDQAFRWVGTAALSGPGQLGYFTSGGNTIIRASNDIDPTSELEIQLTGIKVLTAADFYL